MIHSQLHSAQLDSRSCFHPMMANKMVTLPGLHQILQQLRVPYHRHHEGSLNLAFNHQGFVKRQPSPLDAIAEAAETLHSELIEINYTHQYSQVPKPTSTSPTSSRAKVFKKSIETHPHQCPLCPQVFTRRDNLKQHVLSIHNGKRYPCELCQKSFTQTGSLNLHVKTAHGGMRVKCDLCDKTYARLHGLRQHYMQAHDGKEVSCTDCGMIFSCAYFLNKHNENEHGKQRE